MAIAIGKKIPAWKLPASDGSTVKSAELKGRNYVLYFYPRDNTPGCTTEAQDFRDSLTAFADADTDVLGVSADSIASHEKFISKKELNFLLLSDEDQTVCNKFDVIKLKKMYGKEFEGIERSTFLVDADGVLRGEWRKVKVKGHVAEVLESAAAL